MRTSRRDRHLRTNTVIDDKLMDEALKVWGARTQREAVEAARNVRRLRALGLTVRKTIDTVIATRCIVDGCELLHDDRDFGPFEAHLGLRCVACGT